jgi:hypothetical protein
MFCHHHFSDTFEKNLPYSIKFTFIKFSKP